MNSSLSHDEQLHDENADLRARLAEAEETLRAIRCGEVDSLVVETKEGPQIFSLEAAEAASNRFRGDILSQVSDVVGVIDNDERITYLNSAGERLYRVQPGGMLGRKLSELYQRRWLKQGDEAIAMATLREQGKANWELIHITRDGRELHVQSSVSLMRDANGSVIGIIAVIQDISARKMAEEKLRLSEANLRLSEMRLNKLHRMISDSQIEDSERLQRLLRLGIEEFNLESGIIAEIDNGLYRVALAETPDASVPVGFTSDACDVMCAETLRRNDLMAIESLSQTDWRSHRAYSEFGTEIYFGVPLTVAGKIFGTLCYTSRVKRDHEFSVIDHEFLRLLAQTLGTEMTRQQIAGKLKASEERQRFAMQAAKAGAWDWDIGAGDIVWSQENYALYDFDPAQVVPSLTDWESRVHPDDLAHANEMVRNAVEGKSTEFRSEFRVVRRDGTVTWLLGLGRVQRDPSGTAIRLSGINIDITASKESETQLRESEERYRAATTAVSDVIWTNNADGLMAGEQRGWGEFTGQSQEEYQGYGWSKSVHPEDSQPTIDAWNQAIAEKRIFVFEHRIRRHDGEWRVCAVRAVPVVDVDGTIRQWVGVHADITEQKLAEEKLLAASNTFRHLVDNSPFGVFAVDADFRLVQVSVGAKKVFENVRPLIGRDLAEALHIVWPEPFASESIAVFRKVLESGEPYHAPSTVEARADINEVEAYDWKVERVTLPDGRLGVVCHFYDLSERLRYEDRLREQEQRLRSLVENSPLSVVEWNRDFIITRWAGEAEAIFGWSAQEVVGRPISELEMICEEDRHIVESTLACLSDGVTRHLTHDVRLHHKDRRVIHCVWHHSVVVDADGRMVTVLALGEDVTDRKRAELALAESQRKLQLGIDVATFALAEVNYVTESIELSADATRLFGLGDAATTVPRQKIHDLFHPDDRARIHAAIDDCLAPGGSEQMTIEHRIALPDGTTRWLDIRKRVHFDDSASPPKPIRSTMVARDITEQKESVERIRRGEERLRLAMNAAQLSLWEWDVVNDQISWANELYDRQAMDRMIPVGGFDNFIEMVQVDDRKMVRAAIHESLSEGEPYHCEFRMRRGDGSYRWVLSMAHLSIDGNHAPVRMVGVEMDITDRKENELSLRLSAERLAVAADAAGFGMLHVDLKLQTVTYSPEMKRIIGWRDDQSISLKPGELLDFVHPEDKDRCATHYERAMLKDSPKSRSIDHRIVSTNGMTRWVRLQTKTLFSEQTGEAAQIIGTVLDITQQRNFEEQLKAARDAAEAANQSKSAFVANMSHEIRTPMTAILGYADLLREDVSSEQARQHLGTIQRNGAYLLEIINDILDLSKIEAGKLDIESERFQPARVIEDVRSIMEVRAKDGGLTLDVEYDGKLPKIIQSDAKRLKQILINLVGNAIKFTREGSVKIRVRYEQQDRRLRFDVVDTGIGISAEQQARLFKPFSQGDASVTRNFGGTGLGLAISKRLAEMLGGKITASSTENVGSTFTVFISAGNLKDIELVDYAVAPDQPASELKPADSEPTKLACHVLLVDDRRDIRLLGKLLLSKAGATIDECEDGLLAVEHVTDCLEKDNCPDLILLDMQMPNLDGYQTARKLREIGYAGPIIALTADAMQGDMNECIEAGCNDYLSKPIDAVRLVQLVKQLTEARK